MKLMFIGVDNATLQTARNGRKYYSFWVRLSFENGMYMSVAGWKYFPETGTISSPTSAKGENKFFNLTKQDEQMFVLVQKAAMNTFAAVGEEVGAA